MNYTINCSRLNLTREKSLKNELVNLRNEIKHKILERNPSTQTNDSKNRLLISSHGASSLLLHHHTMHEPKQLHTTPQAIYE